VLDADVELADALKGQPLFTDEDWEGEMIFIIKLVHGLFSPGFLCPLSSFIFTWYFSSIVVNRCSRLERRRLVVDAIVYRCGRHS